MLWRQLEIHPETSISHWGVLLFPLSRIILSALRFQSFPLDLKYTKIRICRLRDGQKNNTNFTHGSRNHIPISFYYMLQLQSVCVQYTRS